MSTIIFKALDSQPWLGVNPYGTPFKSNDSRLQPGRYEDGCGGYWYEGCDEEEEPEDEDEYEDA